MVCGVCAAKVDEELKARYLDPKILARIILFIALVGLVGGLVRGLFTGKWG
jgi:hypothetical protein